MRRSYRPYPTWSIASAKVESTTPIPIETARNDTKYPVETAPKAYSPTLTSRPSRAKIGLRNSKSAKCGMLTIPIAP